MSASHMTTRITQAIHRFAVRAVDAAHNLHGMALQNHYNAVQVEASLLREQLRTLGQETRDATLAAKIAYQRALKDAEDAFNLEVKRVTDAHTEARRVIVGNLDAATTKASETYDALLKHDAAAIL